MATPTAANATAVAAHPPPPARLDATTAPTWRQSSNDQQSASASAATTEDHGDQSSSAAGSDEGFVAARAYVAQLFNSLTNGKPADVRSMYYTQWTEITNAHFTDREWPSPESISSYCGNHELFLLCYNELYFRHIFVHGAPQLLHRFQSWSNYRALFDRLLGLAAAESSSHWLNDMIDEFIYQFQDFYHYRQELSKRSDEEISILRENPAIWNISNVLLYLNSFVEKSGIAKYLSQDRGAAHGSHHHHHHSKHNSLSLIQSLGYFSMIGLCRVHTMLGDYRTALKVLDSIDVDDRRAIFTQVTACHVTLLTNVGFSYLMMRRYVDALDMFSQIIFAQKSSKERFGSFADDQATKHDKVIVLISIVAALSPGIRVDDQVRKQMDKYLDRLVVKLAGSSEAIQQATAESSRAYEELFYYVCPKFILPSTPNFKTRDDHHRDPSQAHLARFMSEVNIQLSLPRVRSFLKLYKSISIEKLARFCDMDTKAIREHLTIISNRSTQIVRMKDGSPPLDGHAVTVSDMSFHIANDTVYVRESSQTKSYAGFFIYQTVRFEMILNELGKKPSAQANAAANTAATPAQGATGAE